jgi:phosphatidylinositol kinase/protein kinase (PI-3  family)
VKSVNFQNLDTLLSFDVVSIFAKVPVDEAYKSSEISSANHTMRELSIIQVKNIIQLLEICLAITYFQMADKFFKE